MSRGDGIQVYARVPAAAAAWGAYIPGMDARDLALLRFLLALVLAGTVLIS